MKRSEAFLNTTHRSFIKKSIVASVVASHLTMFNGLVNAANYGPTGYAPSFCRAEAKAVYTGEIPPPIQFVEEWECTLVDDGARFCNPPLKACGSWDGEAVTVMCGETAKCEMPPRGWRMRM